MTAERRDELEDWTPGNPGNPPTKEEVLELMEEIIAKTYEVESERDKLIEKVGGIDAYNKLVTEIES